VFKSLPVVAIKIIAKSLKLFLHRITSARVVTKKTGFRAKNSIDRV
jgi:hypothetical protein